VTPATSAGSRAVLEVPAGRYAIGVAVTVFAILSQYFVPGLVPGAGLLYGNLPGTLFVVYGLPVLAFAVLLGPGPLRSWRARPKVALWEGLRWYGGLSLLALAIAFGLTAVYALVDPSALPLLQRPNPVVQAAAGDPWPYVGLSFAVGAFEEVIFRGWIFGSWRAQGGTWIGPAAWTSAVFAGVHVYYTTTYGITAPVILPTLFLLGFAFAATFHFSGGNLLVPAALHGAYDASAFLYLISQDAGLLLRFGLVLVGALLALLTALGIRPRTSEAELGTTRLDLPGPSPEGFGHAPASVTLKNAAPLASSVEGPDDALRSILTRARTIAIVGLSDKPERDSNEVARYLKAQGYRIVPVNPALPEVLGERSYAALAAIPSELGIDIVDIFRRSDQVPPIVDEAVARGVPVVWMQLGVEHPEAAAKARAHGLIAFENLCIMQQHRRLRIPPKGAA
jgi:predicted CoA-binding protein/membrane protease YdiL (CAAX protease family)